MNEVLPIQNPQPRGLRKMALSCLKTAYMFSMYAEAHDGWRNAFLDFPQSIWSVSQQHGLKGVLRKCKRYRTLAGSAIAAPPPWESRLPVQNSVGEKTAFTILVPITGRDVHHLELCLQHLKNVVTDDTEIVLAVEQNCVAQVASTCADFQFNIVAGRTLAEAIKTESYRAKTDWLMILEPHAQLRKGSINFVTGMLPCAGSARWIYCDATRSGVASRYRKGLLRPDFSPELLLSQHFTEGLNLVHRSLLLSIDISDGIENHAGVYDLLLRVSEAISFNEVLHWPYVLIELNEAQSIRRLHAEQHRIAARRALKRRGVRAVLTSSGPELAVNSIVVLPKATPSVNIFIATRNAFDLVQKCVTSIYEKTRYCNFRIIVIDNQSDDPALLHFLEAESAANRLTVFNYDAPFNHSEMHNLAIKKFDSDLVVLMNNDIEIITDGWLEQLVGTLELSAAVAGVGPMLLYPDETIQHAGVVLGVHRGAGHFFRGLSPDEPSYLDRAISLQRLSACTAALLLLKRSAYLDVGGFDAGRYPASFNDVDLWIRLQNAGYRCLYQPAVRALHYESKTRPIVSNVEREAVARLQSDWGDELLSDPYHHPAISIENELLFGFRQRAEQHFLQKRIRSNIGERVA